MSEIRNLIKLLRDFEIFETEDVDYYLCEMEVHCAREIFHHQTASK